MSQISANMGITHPTPAVLDALDEKTDEQHPGAVAHRPYGMEARTLPGVTFEEYRYWAGVERQMEAEDNRRYIAGKGKTTALSLLKDRFSTGATKHTGPVTHSSTLAEDSSGHDDKTMGTQGQVTAVGSSSQDALDSEWRNASRALRTAGWGTIFFLVTTDILGWSGAPFVFSSMGYGPGVALYIIFGIAAGFSGWAIWRVFMGLDSARYPMVSFGDPFFRLFGPWSRHAINISQSLQQFLTVAVLVLANAQIIAQLANSSICFVACMIIVMAIGMFVGSIRSLQKLGWLCNLSVWLNVVTFIMICVAAAKYAPDYTVINASTLIKTQGNITTFAGPPPSSFQQQSTNQFSAQFNAVDTMVYAYSGALLFVAFLSEMRHPWDFWKGIFMAQVFICVVYIFFGVFVYSFYGQYSASNITQVIQPLQLQTVANVLSLLTGFIAIFLYFNVGMKTVYREVFEEVFHCPPITTKKGKWLWLGLGPVYWIVAFIVAAGVPNLNGLVGFTGGIFSLNFTYSFPGMIYVGYVIQEAAALPGEGFDPVTGVTTRHDNGMKRWVRGFRKSWYIAVPVSLYVCGGLAASGMGTWAAIEGLIAQFGGGGTVATSFGCAVPV